MFCPGCGAADQSAEIYCRQCGIFLPDLNKPAKRRNTPEEHIKANSVLTLLSAIVSAALAIALYATFLGKEGTPLLIFITAGFLTALFAWQVQTFWRMRLLKRHFKRDIPQANSADSSLGAAPTSRILNEGTPSDAVLISVTDNTTKKLGEKIRR